MQNKKIDFKKHDQQSWQKDKSAHRLFNDCMEFIIDYRELAKKTLDNNSPKVDVDKYKALKKEFVKKVLEHSKGQFNQQLTGIGEDDFEKKWVILVTDILPEYFAKRGVLLCTDSVVVKPEDKENKVLLENFGLGFVEDVVSVSLNDVWGKKIEFTELRLRNLVDKKGNVLTVVERDRGFLANGNVVLLLDNINDEARKVSAYLDGMPAEVLAELKKWNWPKYVKRYPGNPDPLQFSSDKFAERFKLDNLTTAQIAEWLMLTSRIQYAVHIQQWQEGTYWKQSLSSSEELLGQDALRAQEELLIETKMASMRYMEERFSPLEMWELVASAVSLQKNKKGNLAYLSVLDRMIHCIDKQAEKYNFYTGENSYIYKHSRRTHIAGQLYSLTGRQIIEIAQISHRRQLKRLTDVSEFFIDPVERLSWFERWGNMIFGVSGVGGVVGAGVFAWHWHRKRLIFHDYKDALVESLCHAFEHPVDFTRITTEELEFLVKLLIAGKNKKAKKEIDNLLKVKNILLKPRMSANKIIAEIAVNVEHNHASRKQRKASPQAEMDSPLKTTEPDDSYPPFSCGPDIKIPAQILPRQESPSINRRGRLLAKIEIAWAALIRAKISEEDSSSFSEEIKALESRLDETEENDPGLRLLRDEIVQLVSRIKGVQFAQDEAVDEPPQEEELEADTLEQAEVLPLPASSGDVASVEPKPEKTVNGSALRSAKAVIRELKGQKILMDNMIEVLSSRKVLQVDHIERTADGDGVVLTLKELSGFTEFKDASDVLVRVADQDFVFKSPSLRDNRISLLFANASRQADFVKIPEPELNRVKSVFIETNTTSQELQSETLQAIVGELRNNGSTTGVECADYLFQLKIPKQDFILDKPENIPEFMLKNKFGLVHGGFGSAKTTHLIEGVERIILDKKRPVLVLAPQHPITDEITIRAGGKGIPVIRCGNLEDRFNALVRENFARQSGKAGRIFKAAYDNINKTPDDNGFLLTATVMGGVFDWLIKQLNNPESARYLKDLTVVVDEAALINYPELITAIYLLNPEAVFLFGDHIQFKPYEISAQLSRKQRHDLIDQFKLRVNKDNAEVARQMKACIHRYEYSFFEELMGSLEQNIFGLFKNFRNHWIIVELGQKWYEGVCEFESYSKENGDILEEDTLEIIDTSDLLGQLYEKKDLLTGSYEVLDEAKLIIAKGKEFLRKKGKDGKLYGAKDITIITPYNWQIKLICELIDEDLDLEPEQKAILIQNVITSRRIQGGQNKVVLVSLGRSMREQDLRELESKASSNNNPFSFLFDEEKIVENPALTLVGITRASEKTVIVGNRRTLEALTRESRDERAQKMYSWIFDFKKEIDERLKIMRDAEGSISRDKSIDCESLISRAI